MQVLINMGERWTDRGLAYLWVPKGAQEHAYAYKYLPVMWEWLWRNVEEPIKGVEPEEGVRAWQTFDKGPGD